MLPAAGDELFSPIDSETWDVQVIAEKEADTPEVRRTSKATVKKAQGKKKPTFEEPQDSGGGSDDSDFMEEQPVSAARKRGGGKNRKAAAVEVTKRRKLNYTAEGADDVHVEEGGSAKPGKGRGHSKGPLGKKQQHDDKSADSDDDFACMQPKKAGKGKGPGRSKGAGSNGKEAVYVCERGCGFEGDHDTVEKHEQVCGYVRGDQWESDMDEDEEEVFLAKWEASVDRQHQTTRDAPAGLLMPLLPFQRESLAWMCEQEGSKYRGGILAGVCVCARARACVQAIRERSKPAQGSKYKSDHHSWHPLVSPLTKKPKRHPGSWNWNPKP